MKLTISIDDIIIFEQKIKRLGYKHVVYPTGWDAPENEWLVGRKVKFIEDLGHGMTKTTKCRIAKVAMLWGQDIDDNFLVINDRKGNIYKTLPNREIWVK